jgi:hypothetical protein
MGSLVYTQQNPKEVAMGGNNKGHSVRVTKAIMVEVADRMGQGENLLQIVESDHMPSYRAITSAVMRDDEFFRLYREGRVRQAEWHSDRINSLATAPLPTHHADGTPCDSRWLGAEIQRRKLEIETLRWTLARSQPHGIRDKREDAPQAQSITISWAGGDTAIDAKTSD